MADSQLHSQTRQGKLAQDRGGTEREYARAWRTWRQSERLRADGWVECSICGFGYVRGSEEDQRIHRARHREVLRVYEPKPLPTLAALYREHGAFVPVHSYSPRWLRNRLAGLATMFRREVGYEGVPYSADESFLVLKLNPLTSSWHWIIATPHGRAIGGLSARWRDYSDAESCWTWAWVWVIPSERRAGHAQRCWDMLKTKLPGIEPEPPFSPPIARFFASRTDVPDRIRARCSEPQEV
jgi:hypothetical protein